MSISPAHIVRAYLISKSLVYLPSGPEIVTPVQLPEDGTTPCYVSSVPDTPDQLVCIINTEGMLFGRAMEAVQTVHPGVKLIVRTLDDTGYWTVAKPIADALDASTRQTLMVPDDESTHYLQTIVRVGGIITLGEEVGTKRQRWIINARVSFQNQEPSLG